MNRSRRLGLAAVVAVCATGLFLLVRSDAYAQTVAWNYQHMFHGREAFSGPESSIFGMVFRTLGRLVDWAHWKQGVLMIIPVCLPFVVVHVARNGVRLLRRQPVSHLSLLTMTWFLLGLAALFTVEHARGRFSHILLPPAFLAFGLELDFWLKRLDSTRWKWLPVAGIVAATLLTHVRWSSEWLLGPQYALRDANQEIAAVLEPDDAVLGMRAPLLAFDSSADIFYVKHHFNDSADRIARLGATHLLLSNRETATRLLKRSFPEALEDASRSLTLRYRGRNYRLLELGEPLR